LSKDSSESILDASSPGGKDQHMTISLFGFVLTISFGRKIKLHLERLN
jgi:hypothetical protein